MRYFVFVLFFAITTIFAAENFPIMMQIKTDLNIPEDFRGGVEEGLTQNGYSLVSEEIQKEALKEQATQRKKECYDESCLVDTGKMLAAKGLFLVEVTKKSDKLYLFKTKYIDFETGTTQKIKQDYFKFDLNDYEELSKFGKNIIQNMFGKIETKEVMKEVKTKDNSNEKAVKTGEIEIKTKKEEKNVEKFKIEFITIPSNVEVYDSDNNLLGETPFFMNLPKGFLKFSFEKKGFEKLEREIHVKQNEKIEILLSEKIYNFKINSNISGAKVFIDNKEKGITPFEIKLKEGFYSIKVEKDEYDTYFEEIPVKKNGEKLITLNKNIFEIKITSNIEDSKVYIDGVLKGKAPYNVKLKKGNYSIKVMKDYFIPFYEKVLLYDDVEKNIILKKNENIYETKITSNVESDVYINNKLQGKTPIILTLEKDKYSLELKKDGYWSYFGELDVFDDWIVNYNLIKGYKFAFKTGIGSSSYNLFEEINYGFNIGGIYKYYFKNIKFQTELLFMNKNISFNDIDIKQSAIDIPVIIGYNYQQNISIYGGLYISEIIIFNINKGTTLKDNSFVTTFGYLIGIDYIFSRYLIDFRFSKDFNSVINMNKKDLYSELFMISLGYLF